MGINKIGRGIWRIDVHVDSKGRVQRTLHDATKEQAETLYWQLKQELLNSNNPERSLIIKPDVRTFGEILDFYVNRKGEGRTGFLFERMRSELGGIPIELLGERFDRFLQILKEQRAKRTGRKISNSTINRYIAYAKAVCNLACKFELIDKNPINRFTRCSETPRDRVLSEIEIRNLFNILESESRLRYLIPAVRFAFQVPIRRSELVSLKKDSLDLINNVIRLRNGTTKNRRGTFIPIPPDMIEYFRKIPAETDYLFYRYVKRSNTYYSIGDFHRGWMSALDLAGIDDFHFHDLRHISATNLVDCGTPERVVREIANWKTDMLNRYYHMTDKKIMQSVRFPASFGDFLETPKAMAM
jgi:integrase